MDKIKMKGYYVNKHVIGAESFENITTLLEELRTVSEHVFDIIHIEQHAEHVACILLFFRNRNAVYLTLRTASEEHQDLVQERWKTFEGPIKHECIADLERHYEIDIRSAITQNQNPGAWFRERFATSYPDLSTEAWADIAAHFSRLYQ